MISLAQFQKYLPIGIAILGSSLAYSFSNRSRKIDRFFNIASDNLKDVSSPLFHEIRSIRRINDDNDREQHLIVFFDKYGGEATLIYKSGSRYMLELFYDMEDDFREFMITRDRNIWERFWLKFDDFWIIVEGEYWANYSLVYREFRWFRSVWKQNFLIRLFKECMRRLVDILYFIEVVIFFAIFGVIIDICRGSRLFPSHTLLLLVLISLILLIFIGISIMFSSDYFSSTSIQDGKSTFRRIYEKVNPKATTRSKENELKRLKKKKIKIPNAPSNIK